MTSDQIRALALATIRKPTAQLSESQALSRVHSLREKERHTTQSPSTPSRGFGKGRINYSNEWRQYMAEEVA